MEKVNVGFLGLQLKDYRCFYTLFALWRGISIDNVTRCSGGREQSGLKARYLNIFID